MGAIKRIICLASSRKWQERCIAGIELWGEGSRWVRPVSKRPQGEVSFSERCYADNTEPRLLDIMDVPLLEHRPKAYQRENWLLDPSTRWSRIGRLKPLHLESYAEPLGMLWQNDFHSASGLNDRLPVDICQNLESSLKLIHVKAMEIRVYRPGEFYDSPPKRLQAWFRFGAAEYILRLTDPEVEAAFLGRQEGIYRLGPCYLTISLGEPFNGFCYKLIAGVIEDQ
jgi:hypothetical protein